MDSSRTSKQLRAAHGVAMREDELICLGYPIAGCATYHPTFKAMVRALGAVFWRQRLRGRALTTKAQMANLNCTAGGVMGFRCTAITVASSYSKALDAVQRRMISSIIGQSTHPRDAFPEQRREWATAHWKQVASLI
jgi:hypothetical protein